MCLTDQYSFFKLLISLAHIRPSAFYFINLIINVLLITPCGVCYFCLRLGSLKTTIDNSYTFP